ncbi:metal-dependent hydrolase [Rubritalea marina]|uniref:metal-dependent hydrolase n=1 Tax=Rubritalea marina TaxID=361055 RepID=UPI000362596E|nr:metal-dependent hydrolase [Rubritalea marina]
MDSITQATLGALCGELVLRRQIGWKGMAWGFFFGTLPDLDVLMSPWLDPIEGLRNHRGLSHSLFLMLTMSPLFGLLLAKLHKSVSFKRTTGFVLLAWFTHVLIDCFTSYGTQIFEPFSDNRFAFSNMSIIDFFFTIPMLLGCLLCLFFKRESLARSRIVWASTIWICFYSTLSFISQAMAKHHFREALQAQGVEADKLEVSPTLTNIILWRMLAKVEYQGKDAYAIAYWSHFDTQPIQVEIVSNPHKLAEPFLENKSFQTLDWFSKGYWRVFQDQNDSESIYFVDMRFEGILNDEGTVKLPPFIWKLNLDDQGKITSQRANLRSGVDPKRAVGRLQRRIMGDKLLWRRGQWPWGPSELLPPPNTQQ